MSLHTRHSDTGGRRAPAAAPEALVLLLLIVTLLHFIPLPAKAHSPLVVYADALPEANYSERIAHVPIITYHSVRPLTRKDGAGHPYVVTPAVFREEMQYLVDNGYHTTSFDALTEFFAKGTPLPTKPVIIAFDDGLESQYTYAFPILKKDGLTATFFIISGSVGNPPYLSWQQVKALSDAGMGIGAHSETHPRLGEITSVSKLRNEIAGSKHAIEQHVGTTTNVFAYPYGSYSPMVVSVVEESGFIAARSFSNFSSGAEHSASSVFSLSSARAPDNLTEFEVLVSQ